MTETSTRTETTFVYLVEGEPCVGTVTDYARAVEAAHYGGFDVDTTVWTFADGKPVAMKAVCSSTPYDEDDYGYMTIELEFRKGDPETATIRIDGRS